MRMKAWTTPEELAWLKDNATIDEADKHASAGTLLQYKHKVYVAFLEAFPLSSIPPNPSKNFWSINDFWQMFILAFLVYATDDWCSALKNGLITIAAYAECVTTTRLHVHLSLLPLALRGSQVSGTFSFAKTVNPFPQLLARMCASPKVWSSIPMMTFLMLTGSSVAGERMGRFNAKVTRQANALQPEQRAQREAKATSIKAQAAQAAPESLPDKCMCSGQCQSSIECCSNARHIFNTIGGARDMLHDHSSFQFIILGGGMDDRGVLTTHMCAKLASGRLS